MRQAAKKTKTQQMKVTDEWWALTGQTMEKSWFMPLVFFSCVDDSLRTAQRAIGERCRLIVLTCCANLKISSGTTARLRQIAGFTSICWNDVGVIKHHLDELPAYRATPLLMSGRQKRQRINGSYRPTGLRRRQWQDCARPLCWVILNNEKPDAVLRDSASDFGAFLALLKRLSGILSRRWILNIKWWFALSFEQRNSYALSMLA